jgi:hypothetical protein
MGALLGGSSLLLRALPAQQRLNQKRATRGTDSPTRQGYPNRPILSHPG